MTEPKRYSESEAILFDAIHALTRMGADVTRSALRSRTGLGETALVRGLHKLKADGLIAVKRCGSNGTAISLSPDAPHALAARAKARPWSKEEFERARMLIDEHGLGMEDVAILLGRTHTSILQKFKYGPAAPMRMAQGVPVIEPGVLIERDRRIAALDAQSITGAVFGDPPPGFSALDGYQGGRPRR